VALKSGAFSDALATLESNSSFESSSGEAEAAMALRPTITPTTARIAATPRISARRV
jgi:hypothetical protein